MSTYCTLWVLRFPWFEDLCAGCEWVEVMGQGVAAHVGSPTAGHGYETGDPYASVLPPLVPNDAAGEQRHRASRHSRPNECAPCQISVKKAAVSLAISYRPSPTRRIAPAFRKSAAAPSPSPHRSGYPGPNRE